MTQQAQAIDDDQIISDLQINNNKWFEDRFPLFIDVYVNVLFDTGVKGFYPWNYSLGKDLERIKKFGFTIEHFEQVEEELTTKNVNDQQVYSWFSSMGCNVIQKELVQNIPKTKELIDILFGG